MTLMHWAQVVLLALCVWREARGEPQLAQIAVAYSILNRVDRPSWWGRTVLEVLFKKLQYSSLTYPQDPQLTTWPRESDPSWSHCLQVAADVLDGRVPNPVPGADSYYDTSIAGAPWATDDVFVGQVGRLKFYNVDRDTEAQAAGAGERA